MTLRHCTTYLFLSTLSLRRATNQQPAGTTRTTYFYPRSPCGERQPAEHHANSQQEFLSTLSLRRATVTVLGIQHRTGISIHALLAESDPHSYKQTAYFFYFYPRSPCGERLRQRRIELSKFRFLSTLSLRRATADSPTKWTAT